MSVVGEQDKPLLELKNVTKKYGAIPALSNVSFTLYKGEIHCLVGENGAGKSTLIKILSGAISPNEGTIILDQVEHRHMSPALSRKLGIETIYQENIVCPDVSVMENIYLGVEYHRWGIYDRSKMLSEAGKLIREMGVDLAPKTLARNLSPGQQKIVQVLKAMVKKARILILDEPTAAFSTTEIDTLLKIVLRIREQGTGIIFISHHLEEVFRIADRITVIKDGEIIATHMRNEYTSDTLISEMTGRHPSSFFRKQHHETGETLLVANHFTRRDVVKDVSFALKRGEILGFAGMVGSGRSELMRLIYGADRRDSGELMLNGRRIEITGPGKAIRNGICLLPEDRKKEANLPGLSVRDNIVLSRINLSRRLFREIRKEILSSQEYIDLLRIKTPGPGTPINNLSGGNQQKVIIARWLLVNSDIFIFDEPTRGIDVGAKEEIYRLMSDLVEKGKSIIMISSELPELIAMSDRVLIMKSGELVGEVSGCDINEAKILEYSIGRAVG